MIMEKDDVLVCVEILSENNRLIDAVEVMLLGEDIFERDIATEPISTHLTDLENDGIIRSVGFSPERYDFNAYELMGGEQ